MGQWITGDIHTHSDCCEDGTLPVAEVVERSLPYCDFLAISGHARNSDNWGERQYRAILDARKRFPDIPIFHTGELEFPIERHVMMLTQPEHREFELQRELVRRFDRRAGVVGIERAEEELRFVEEGWGLDAFMVFNHPNAPEVAFEHLERLAQSELFKVMACIDRGERRAEQVWDVGGDWDRLLMQGRRIFARFGSDFHAHFSMGGHDYWPGEFVQDHLWVENNSYRDILSAYRSGAFYCTVDTMISDPVFELRPAADPGMAELRLEFQIRLPVDHVDIVSDGRTIRSFTDVPIGAFRFSETVPSGLYYRVRGAAKPRSRKYGEGDYQPIFLINPIFAD